MSADKATSLGVAAEDYEASRPDYQFDTVAWMLEKLPHGASGGPQIAAPFGQVEVERWEWKRTMARE